MLGWFKGKPLSFHHLISRFSFCNVTNNKPAVQPASETIQSSNSPTSEKPYFRPPPKVEPAHVPIVRPRTFINGRCLIYLNNQHLWTPWAQTLHLTAPFVYILFLIKNNPWYLTFPAALPLMVLANAALLLRWVGHKRHNKYIVERVYLLEGGVYLEVCYSNHIRRTLKDTEDRNLFYHEHMISPDRNDPNNFPQAGSQFPEDAKNINSPIVFHYGWTKWDCKHENYVFPKYYEHADWEILVPLMKGQPIDTTGWYTHGQIDVARNFPTVQQELAMLSDWKKIAQGQQVEYLDANKSQTMPKEASETDKINNTVEDKDKK